MNRDQFEKNWKKIKGKVKERWRRLMDEDVDHCDGKYDRFIGKLQKRYGYSKEQAEGQLREWKYEENQFSGKDHNEGNTFGQKSPERYFWKEKRDEGEKRRKAS